jgi:hypothetical protein
MFGFHHFDNLGGTLIVLVQYTISDSAYDPLWAALQSEPDVKGLIGIFFFFISCLNTFITLDLALAVITGTFKEVVLEDLSRAAVESGQAVLGLRGVRRDSCEIEDEHEHEDNNPASGYQHSESTPSMWTPTHAWAERMVADSRFLHATFFVIVAHTVAMTMDAKSLEVLQIDSNVYQSHIYTH